MRKYFSGDKIIFNFVKSFHSFTKWSNSGEKRKDSMIGRRVGVYKLKREIGRGGMGAVYIAEHADGEFRQTVAVKLIKRGIDTDLILKRFCRERQLIAALGV